MVIMVIGVRVTGVMGDGGIGGIMVTGVRVTGVMGDGGIGGIIVIGVRVTGVMGGIAHNTFFGQLNYIMTESGRSRFFGSYLIFSRYLTGTRFRTTQI
jgi:hypothetical protein